MENTKITLAQKYDAIIEAIADMDIVFDDGTSAIDFLADRKSKLSKAGSSKAAEKKKADNENLKDIVVTALADAKLRVSDIVKLPAIAERDLSSSKVTYLLGSLVKDGRVERSTDKKVAFYSAI